MNKDPWFRNRAIRDGIYHAIYEKMQADPSVYIMGEGSHMKVHFDAPQIEKDFGDRVLTLPISEDANTNFAVGLSLAGIIPIVDVISSDFLYRTMDAICNTAAKIGDVNSPRPIIIRAEFLTGGPTSGQRIESLFAHVPGLNVVVPSNPYDACGLMKTALETKGVTIFFEDRMIEDKTTPDVVRNFQSAPTIPFGQGRLVHHHTPDGGSGLTVVSYGLTVRMLEVLFAKKPPEAELIDLRTLYPLDMQTIRESLSRTGSLLVVEPDTKFLGIGAEIVARAAETCSLRSKPIRLGGPHITIPASRDLHDRLFPTEAAVLTAIQSLR